MIKIVITGGTWSGKTTVIKHLKKEGFKIVSETAIELIADLNKKYGVEGQKEWRRNNQSTFQILLAETQKKKESKIKAKKYEIVFFDRGLYDTLAYCKIRKIKVPRALVKIVKDAHYDKVFVLDTLSNFDNRSETGRTCDKKTSIKGGNYIKKVYKKYGVEVICVKEMSIRKRIKFIEKHL